jgi:hypothetical protein
MSIIVEHVDHYSIERKTALQYRMEKKLEKETKKVLKLRFQCFGDFATILCLCRSQSQTEPAIYGTCHMYVEEYIQKQQCHVKELRSTLPICM